MPKIRFPNRFLPLVFLFALVSCAPAKIHQTFGFVDLENLNELSGTYAGTATVSKRHHYPINVLQSFYIEDEKAESFTLSFPGPGKVTLEYTIRDGNTVSEKTIELTGNKAKYGFEISLKDNHVFVPVFFENSDVDNIIIGKNPKGELIIRNYRSKSTSVLGIGEGSQYVDVRVFKRL